ncbi:trichohyalin-like [Bactrocera neohumeralis]|uniref:trichohyalin-like n=1 Tax=Bactrocera neohumeralis TaxID=98809 RepID=UPI002165F3A7|nr:trichohyalin-like [Bactrocera neohumeralis]
MPSTAKHCLAKRKQDQRRAEAHSTSRQKEVRELWFNPHATEICESRMNICLCDCDCHIWQDENVQRELRKLANAYSHKNPPGMKDEEETEPKPKTKKGKVSSVEEEEKEPTKRFLCFKKSSTKRSHSKQREEKEQRKRQKSKEEDNTKKVHEKSISHSSNRPFPVNRRFKTREEAKRYRELKAIYTTKPRNPQHSDKQNDTETKSNPQNTIEAKGRSPKKHAASSSADSVTTAAQRQHRSRKIKTEPRTRPQGSNDSGYPRDRSYAPMYADEREHMELKKDDHKDSEVGCCGMRKKSKAKKQQREYEAYTPAHCSDKQTPRPNLEAECAPTAGEMELLEMLRATYTREVKPEHEQKSKPAAPTATTTEEETGCCGSNSKKKQQQAEADLCEQCYYCECSCGDNYPKEIEQHQATEWITQTNDSKSKQYDKAAEPFCSCDSSDSKNGNKEHIFKYPTREMISLQVDEEQAPRKTKSVGISAKHKNEIDTSKSVNSMYTTKRKPKNIKGTKNQNPPKDEDSEKTSCCSFLCRKKQKIEGDKPQTKTKLVKKRKKPHTAVSFSPEKPQKRRQQVTKPIEKEKGRNVNVNRRKQPAFHPKPEPKTKSSPKTPLSSSKNKPQQADGRKARRRNQPAFHPKPESKTQPKVKTSSSSVNRRPPPGDKRKATARGKIRPLTKPNKAKPSSKQPERSSLKKDTGSETSCCPCLRAKNNFEQSNIKEKGHKKDKPEAYAGSKRKPAKVKSGEKVQEKPKKRQRKPSPTQSHEKVQRMKPKQSGYSKQQASKVESREKLEKKQSGTSCWSCFRKNKTKKSDTSKKEPSKNKSTEKLYRDRPKDDSKQKLSKHQSQEKFKKEKSKKHPDSKQKASKSNSKETLDKKTSESSCWSCRSGDNKEKANHIDESKRRPAKSKSEQKLQKDHPNKSSVSKQKHAKASKSQEKIERKSSQASCWSCRSSDKKEKTKESDLPKKRTTRSKSQDNKQFARDPARVHKNSPKKTGDSKQKPFKAKSQEKVQKQSSETSCWSCRSNKEKDKKQPSRTKIQDKTLKDRPMTKSKSQNKIQKEKTKRPRDSKQKPSKGRSQEKVQKQSSDTSCWSCRSSGGKDKEKKPNESRKKPSKSKSQEKIQRDKPKKPTDSKQTPSKGRSQEKVEKQSSNTSCWSCRSSGGKNKEKKPNESRKKPSKSKSQEKIQRDKPKKPTDSMQTPSKGRSQEKVQKQSSNTSCWSCRSSGGKDKEKKPNESRKKPSTSKSRSKELTDSKATSQDKVPNYRLRKLIKPNERPTKVKSQEKVKGQKSETSCCSSRSKSEKNKSTKLDASQKSSSSKTQLSKAKSQEQAQKKQSSCCSKGTSDRDSKTKPSKAKQKEVVQEKPIKKYTLFSRRSKKEKSKEKAAPDHPVGEDLAKPKKGNKKAEKTKPSESSFCSCCSSSHKLSKDKDSKSKEDNCAVKTKPEDISYCKALYQELENIIMQQNQCPIMISQTRINKAADTKSSKSSLKSKQEKQEHQKQKGEKTNQNTKEKRASKQKNKKTIPNQNSKQRSRSQIRSEKSTSDLDMEKAYMPEYVLGKPQRTGAVIARARKVRYSLLPSLKAQKKYHKHLYKGCRHEVAFQT